MTKWKVVITSAIKLKLGILITFSSPPNQFKRFNVCFMLIPWPQSPQFIEYKCHLAVLHKLQFRCEAVERLLEDTNNKTIKICRLHLFQTSLQQLPSGVSTYTIHKMRGSNTETLYLIFIQKYLCNNPSLLFVLIFSRY